MPYVNITETADLIDLPVSTEVCSTVLIPLIYVDASSEGAKKSPKTYSSLSSFTDDFKENDCKSIAVGSETKLDPSYTLITDLLSRTNTRNNIKVVVHPIKVGSPTIDVKNTLETDIVTNNGYDHYAKNANLFNIKYLTTGAWPSVWSVGSGSEKNEVNKIPGKMADVASKITSAVALLNFEDDYDEFKATVNALDPTNSSAVYLTGFWPNSKVTGQDTSIPGSFYYLHTHFSDLENYPDHFATAGKTRGRAEYVRNGTRIPFDPTYEVGEGLMHILQHDSGFDVEAGLSPKCTVNPIMMWPDDGYLIYGNRTLLAPNALNESFLEYLNIRIMLCEIKKMIKRSAERITFEPNDEIAWINFKYNCNQLLDELKGNRGLEWYRWEKQKTQLNGSGPVKQNQIVATLRLKPIVAVEAFDIGVLLTDQNAEISEGV